ncbi:MAG: GerMN domain-containing protein [Acidimicrobiales bacterium]
MRSPCRAAGVLAAVVLLGTVAAGCAIPTQDRPSTIAPSRVPYRLLDPQLPTTSTTVPRLTSLVPVKIYLLSPNNQLTSVQRFVVSPAPLTAVLTSLVVGPTSSEAAAGTTTEIPNTVRVLSATTAGTIVTVNFNEAFADIAGDSTELAVSQVVSTVTAQNGLGTGVVFEIDGKRTSVPVASGAQVSGPVNFLQFVTPTTTTTTAAAT